MPLRNLIACLKNRLCGLSGRRGTSLIEMMITITIFSIVAVMATVGMINTMKSSKRIQSQVFLYTEAQTLMDQLALSVARNTVDYEAYYARLVQEESGWHTENYGYYGQAFYDPGDGGYAGGPYIGIADYGAYCEDGSSYYPEGCPSETPNYDDLDTDMGAHPFPDITDYSGWTYSDEEYMNAMCERNGSAADDCTGIDYFVVDELILVNGGGDERTVFVREANDEDAADFRVSKVVLSGEDSDGDGVVDNWFCTDDYTCTETDGGSDEVPNEEDLETTVEGSDTEQKDFVPITPSSIDVEEFYMFITPNEDPYRAFAEADVQIQPQVTIVLTVSLSDDYSEGILGDPPSITIQRTISTGVYGEVVSYE